MRFEEDQVAVVTGAASGIGLALAAQLAERGLHVWMLDVEAPALEAAAATLRAQGGWVDALPCDVTNAARMAEIAAEIEGCGPGVDLLVNNAGVGGLLGPVWTSPPQDWSWVIGVNLFGVVNGVRAFAPAMVRRGAGHVLNVASLAGVTAPPFLAPYSASKHAVIALTESLVAEFTAVGSGVKVSVACPGNVVSGIHVGDRNRPAELKPTAGADPALLALIRPVFDEIMRQGMMPTHEAARRILEGVERDALYIFTHPDEHAAALDRAARLQTALREA